ncbi:MAG: preprotein translocase subunit SecG [Candidatus Binatia bacterium]
MFILITIIHVVVCIGLILVVLLQTGKGAEIGAVFGGSSSTIFGSSGAGNFLTRLTTGMAIVFMITSLMLGYLSGRRPSTTIFDNRAPVVEPGAPAQPSAPADSAGSGAVSPSPEGALPQKSPNR